MPVPPVLARPQRGRPCAGCWKLQALGVTKGVELGSGNALALVAAGAVARLWHDPLSSSDGTGVGRGSAPLLPSSGLLFGQSETSISSVMLPSGGFALGWWYGSSSAPSANHDAGRRADAVDRFFRRTPPLSGPRALRCSWMPTAARQPSASHESHGGRAVSGINRPNCCDEVCECLHRAREESAIAVEAVLVHTHKCIARIQVTNSVYAISLLHFLAYDDVVIADRAPPPKGFQITAILSRSSPRLYKCMR